MPEDDPPPANVHSKPTSQTSDISRKQSTGPTVHYPEEIAHVPSAQYHGAPSKLDHRLPSFVSTDEDDDEEEDSDWSGDEDLADEEAKFKQKMGLKARRWTIWRIFTLLFSSLIGSIVLAGILITPALLVHFLWYKPHPTSYRYYVDINIQAWLFWAAANVVISWGLAMIVDITPASIRILISISWGHVSETLKSHIELYDTIKDTIKPMLYAASAWLSWVILFQNIFGLNSSSPGASSAPYTNIVAQVVEFFFFLVLVVSAQRMLSHAMAFVFHRTAYRERLEELRRGLRVIEKLREYKPQISVQQQQQQQHHHTWSSNGNGIFNLNFIRPFSEKGSNRRLRSESVSQGYDCGNDADTEDNKGKKGQDPLHDSPLGSGDLNPTSSSAFNPIHEKQDASISGYPPSRQHIADKHVSHRQSQNPVIQAARALKAVVLHDARHIKRDDDNDDRNGLNLGVNSASEAKQIARAIYKSLRDRYRTYLTQEDFQPVFVTPEETQEAFRVFDKDNNGDIARSEIKATILRVYNERRILSCSMRDVGVALKSLDHILLFFAFIILFFISLSIFGIDITHLLSSVYTVGIAASFIFKNTASNVFDAIMFLFVTHPFDTGDRCFVDTENLVVKKMGLLATVFVRSDGTETYYSNSQLFTKFVTNVRRSDKMVESLTMQVAWGTPLEKLDALETRLNDWLQTEENRWFQPKTTITIQSISFQRYLDISINIPHNSTWQDWGMKGIRRTAFHAAVQYYCDQLGITAIGRPPMRIVFVGSDTEQYTSEAETRPKGRGDGAVGSPRSFLGFAPPDQNVQHMRARKSKSRRAALQGIGGDGGDG